ncbi:MAG: hypothetical protein JNK21_12650 [Rhodospirillaceae bacterium]|nr:hypothetical protein [Rhodospirillaceae bacterium]
MKYVFFAVLALTLASCMGTPWQQAGKTSKQVSADLRSCERDAEAQTLAAEGTTRSDYGMNTRGPNTTLNPRGPSPLEMKDQVDLTDRYDKAVDRCMRGMGYRQEGR